MKIYLTLTKVMLKNMGDVLNLNLGRDSLSRKISAVAIILTLIFSFGMLEVMLYSGYKALYSAVSASQPELLPTVVFLSSSIVIFMFGILSIPAIFFHATDIEYLLPMPLKPIQILGSKFTVSLVYEYIISSLMILPILAAMIGHVNILRLVVYGVVSILAIPVLPLAYGAIISLLVFRFTSFGKHRDLTNIVRVAATLIMILIFYSLQTLFQMSGNAAQYIQTGISISNKIAFMFPHVIFLGRAVSAGVPALEGALYLIVGIAIAAISVILFLFMGIKMYFKCVVGINQQSSNKNRIFDGNNEKLIARRNILYSYVKKEISLLFRSPVTLLNCVSINVIIPFVAVMPYFMSQESSALSSLDFSNPMVECLSLAIIGAACMLMGGMNFVAATCISREGKSFELMKLIPVKYSVQMNAKVLSGAVIGICGSVMLLVPATLLFELPAYISVIGFVLGLPGLFITNYICFAVDLSRPSLVWDNEQVAVKQNLNTLIGMAISAIVAAAPIVLYVLLPKNLVIYFSVTISVLSAILFIVYKMLKSCLVKAFNALP